MATVSRFPKSRQIAVIPERVFDPINGWTLVVQRETLRQLQKSGCDPTIIPLQTRDDGIDIGVLSYIRATFDDIHAPASLSTRLRDPRLARAAAAHVERRRNVGKEDFYRRVLVAPDLKNGLIRLSQRFATALRYGSHVIPVLLADEHEVESRADVTDATGIFLPGSDSDYHPEHYSRTSTKIEDQHDPKRDRLVRTLVQKAYADDIPLFGICSGIQGLAVFGKHKYKLHQNLSSLRRSHHFHNDEHQKRENFHATHIETIDRFHLNRAGAQVKAKRYAAAHNVTFSKGTFIAGLLGNQGTDYTVAVNSSHRQAIDEDSVNPGQVSIEGVAPDGTIEALHDRSGRFFLGVQFHPEALFLKNVDQHPLERKLYRRLFWAFELAVEGWSWRDIIHPRAATGNWRNRGMARVYMTAPGSIQQTPEFVTGLRENVLIP